MRSHIPNETRATAPMHDKIVDGFGSDSANVARQLALPLHVFSPQVAGRPVKSLHRSNHRPYDGLESRGMGTRERYRDS
jgi:hypothetical protein